MKNRLMDSEGEGEAGMILEISIAIYCYLKIIEVNSLMYIFLMFLSMYFCKFLDIGFLDQRE